MNIKKQKRIKYFVLFVIYFFIRALALNKNEVKENTDQVPSNSEKESNAKNNIVSKVIVYSYSYELNLDK